MLASPVSRPLSRFPLLLALPFLTVLGVLALTSAEVEPIWPEALAPSQSSPVCAMPLNEEGPPPAAGAEGCTKTL